MKKEMNLKDKKVLVFGAGISGVAAYNLLLQIGAVPVLYDGNVNLGVIGLQSRLADGESARVILGELQEQEREKFDFLLVSPGIALDTEIPLWFAAKGKQILGEIELAYLAGEGEIIAITGTNGKTTTTSLVGEIIRNYRGKAHVVGNIGIPYTEVTLQIEEKDAVVAEVSSFQLETIHTFHPHISAILNITPDHLNRHHTMENYIEAKKAVTKNQTKADYCILNYDDEITRKIGEEIDVTVSYFSVETKLQDGCFLCENEIVFAQNGVQTVLFKMDEMKLLGVHNAQNVMAAILMCHALGIPMDEIIKSVKSFRAVEHRIEYVRTCNGVDYYNDSKGTNPDAAIKGIQAMNKKTVLIGGGYDKDSSYDEWIEAFDGKVKALILLGQTADKIEACARKHGFKEIYRAKDLEETVQIAASVAQSGDAVLLSPACASWGMFPNYEVRGKMFKEYVEQLKDLGGC